MLSLLHLMFIVFTSTAYARAENTIWATLSVPNPPISVKDLSNYTIIRGENNELKVVPLDYHPENPPFARAEWFEETTPQKDGVRFELYTLSNVQEPQILKLNDVISVSQSNFNPQNPTRIFIHGWNSDGFGAKLTPRFSTAYFTENKHNVNFIAVKWQEVTAIPNYFNARQQASDIGEYLAKFVDFMFVRAGLKFETLKIMGHSIGAHIAGICGKMVTKGKVDTIVGLDPALPLFNFDDIDRLAETDASYVEVIHTNTGTLGFSEPIGHADFYPNGGRTQPGCETELFGDCSHSRSYELYLESISKPEYYAFQCESFEKLKTGNCSVINELVKMGGEPGEINKKGVYYLNTNSYATYCKGKDGAVELVASSNSIADSIKNMFNF